MRLLGSLGRRFLLTLVAIPLVWGMLAYQESAAASTAAPNPLSSATAMPGLTGQSGPGSLVTRPVQMVPGPSVPPGSAPISPPRHVIAAQTIAIMGAGALVGLGGWFAWRVGPSRSGDRTDATDSDADPADRPVSLASLVVYIPSTVGFPLVVAATYNLWLGLGSLAMGLPMMVILIRLYRHPSAPL